MIQNMKNWSNQLDNMNKGKNEIKIRWKGEEFLRYRTRLAIIHEMVTQNLNYSKIPKRHFLSSGFETG